MILMGVRYNVLALGEEADFEALNCLPALNPLFCLTPVSSWAFFSCHSLSQLKAFEK